MSERNNRDSAVFCHVGKNSQKLNLVPDVKERCGLVQDYDLGLLTYCPCQEDTLPLAVADLGDIPVCNIQCINFLKRILDNIFVVGSEHAETAGIRIAPGRDKLEAGHKLRTDALGKHNSKLLRHLLSIDELHILIIQIHSAGYGGQMLGYTFKDSGFTGSIGAYQCHDLPFCKGKGDVGNKRDTVITYGK